MIGPIVGILSRQKPYHRLGEAADNRAGIIFARPYRNRGRFRERPAAVGPRDFIFIRLGSPRLSQYSTRLVSGLVCSKLAEHGEKFPMFTDSQRLLFLPAIVPDPERVRIFDGCEKPGLSDSENQ